MVIPKQFEGMEDLESMFLTNILGILVALKDDLISFQQAENYWFSNFTLELFEQMNVSKELLEITKQCIELKEYQPFKKSYYEEIEKLISKTKRITSKYYTEYENAENANVLN